MLNKTKNKWVTCLNITCCQTTARPRTCLVQTSLISFTFRDVHSSRSCSEMLIFVMSDGPYSVIYSGVLLSSEPCGSWSL